MQLIEDLIHRAHNQGVRLWVDGGRLHFRASGRDLPAELRSELSAHKEAIIAFLRGAAQKGAGEPPPIRRASRAPRVPLSFAQERLWFLDQLSQQGSAYLQSAAVLIAGPLDVAALERSLSHIVERHEILRSAIVVEAGTPYLEARPAPRISLPVVDARSVPEEAWASEILRAAAARGEDAGEAGPLRMILFRLPDDPRASGKAATRHALLSQIHHIYIDMWSMSVFGRELSESYAAFLAGRAPNLPDLPIQFADYALWQREWLRGDAIERQVAHWTRRLAGAPALLNLPTDEPRPPVYQFRGSSLPVSIPGELTAQLQDLCRREGATLFMGLLAVFAIVLSRYSSQTDLVIGSPVANRRRRETEALIGFFANTLALRLDLSGPISFEALLRRVKAMALEAYEHQDVPFEKVVEALRPERNTSHPPVVQVMFALQNTPTHELSLPGLRASTLPLEATRSRFDLTLDIWSQEPGLSGRLEYNTSLFHRDTMERLLGHLTQVMSRVVRDPAGQIEAISLLTPIEEQERERWNATRTARARALPWHTLIEDVVRRAPDAIALRFEDEQVTYRELNAKANKLARHLRKLGAGPESLVAIALERSPLTVISTLAVLKAGAAFMPLDPRYPPRRTAWMLEDARPIVLLTQSRLREDRSSLVRHAVCLDTEWSDIEPLDARDLDAPVDGANLAYVIYTSGSTGAPKGVQIAHAGLTNLAWDYARLFRVDDSSRVLQFATMNFDISVGEIASALLRGATLHLASAEDVMPGPNLQRLLRQQRITHAILPPSALAMLTPDDLPSLQTLAAGAEACSPHLAALWARGRRFLNAYGPTEATIFASVFEHDGDPTAFPIGTPIANMSMEILDARGNRAPVGVPGELHIGGVGLARGYLNRPGQTSERFVPNPFAQGASDTRLYKTGDLAQYRADGAIDYLGRMDRQVKIRGVRVELGEIEAALGEHPQVKACAVVLQDHGGERRIIACFSPANDGPPRPGVLRQFLAERLPDAMIPSAFLSMESLPTTHAGKIDRLALTRSVAELGADPRGADGGVVMPRNARELRLAELWHDLLGVWPIGVTHDFFELGGHSYLAVKLISRINSAFGGSLPLATLFQSPTIEKLAFALRDRAVPWSPMVPLQPRGSKAALFCIHPAGGAVFAYARLAPLLGFDRPVYALQERGIERGVAPYADTQEMASAYAEAIREVQPEGPYTLLGWSAGGTTAFEIARLLEKAGHTVSKLIMIDTPAPSGVTYEKDDVKFLVERLRPGGIELADLDKYATQEEKLTYTFEEIKRSLPETLVFDAADALHFLALHKNHNRILSEYTPSGAFSGEIVYIKAEDQIDYDVHMGRPLEDWPAYAGGGFVVDYTPGNHFNVFEPGFIKSLAERISAQLDRPR